MSSKQYTDQCEQNDQTHANILIEKKKKTEDRKKAKLLKETIQNMKKEKTLEKKMDKQRAAGTKKKAVKTNL